MSERCFIAMGGNLGDRLATLVSAVKALKVLTTTHRIQVSPVYETAPVGPAGQPNYLNAVTCFHTKLAPEALLDALQGIEDDHGRVRAERWGPRTLDLDILYYGEHRVRSPRLFIPHPRLYERWFTLKPISDLDPDFVDPEHGVPVTQMLERLTPTGEIYEQVLVY